ncbi:MAG: sigma-54-dependent Fis family transcriptional regulator [Armatimonadetes bacterium]|nr:sigma-54-dependent Fis family transcriptional regulator [Armatimonadota bacterium]
MKTQPNLLIVDDEPNIRRILQVAFEKAGYKVFLAENAHQAGGLMAEQAFDVVLTDVTMPGKSGYEFLRESQAAYPETPVIVMTAFGTIPQAIQAIRDGAFEYVTKPFDLEALKRIVAAAVETGAPSALPSKKAGKAQSSGSSPFIAESPKMREIFETVQQVASSRATVLITGESGVGKEVVAKALHTLSSRAKKPFVAVSCAALPETLLESELFGYEKGAFTGANGAKLGRFELANEGTLFLDEIGDIPMPIQIKLLRVLQEREFERLGSNKPTRVDVRLVTATNRDLRDAVQEGIFRLDLLYRLQVVELEIPALRDRIEDIEPLAMHFLKKYAQENDVCLAAIEPEALQIMQTYAWPGNVRELENAIERATVLADPKADKLTAKLLPHSLAKAA